MFWLCGGTIGKLKIIVSRGDSLIISKLFPSHVLTSQISGGLGNQLFQYYAGFYAAAKSGRHLILDDFRTKEGIFYSGRVQDKMKISGLRGVSGLDADFLRDTPIARVLSRNKIACSTPIYRKKILVRDYSPNGEMGSDLIPDQLEFEGLKYINIRIRGNMQSLEVVYAAIARGATSQFEILAMNDLLMRSLKQIQELKPIGIHLRLKDYIGSNEELLLGSRYYVDAISYLKSFIPKSPIWLFTDDVNLALELLPSYIQKEVTLVVDPSVFSDVETLFLMSKCEGLVMANSTFSFWAGFYQESQLVVAPEPWFKNESAADKNVTFGYPSNWKTFTW